MRIDDDDDDDDEVYKNKMQHTRLYFEPRGNRMTIRKSTVFFKQLRRHLPIVCGS